MTDTQPRQAWRRCRECGQRASLLGPAVAIHMDGSVSHLLCWQADRARWDGRQRRDASGRFIPLAKAMMEAER